ncbi:MAG TPA: SDR family oxidoreductase [Candidatus Binatia bacterium]|nr:SDR family oxidoreductase [Candidatus Binatia bacterium]
MAEELAGRVAIVTGGANGLGRATVELFVEEGAKVVIADVDAERGEEVAAKLGGAATFKRTDVANANEIQELVDFAVARFGGLHVMFNNAGISGAMSLRFLEDELKDFQRLMAVNLFGVMVGSQRAARHMVKHGGGSIINTTSIAGINAGGGVMTYRVSKAAVIHFTRCLAIDLADHGIRVNCIAPGLIPTAIASFDRAPVMRVIQPLKRQGQPRDVANAALFLASERSAQTTGMVLPVDGGITVGAPTHRVMEIMAAKAKPPEQ